MTSCIYSFCQGDYPFTLTCSDSSTDRRAFTNNLSDSQSQCNIVQFKMGPKQSSTDAQHKIQSISELTINHPRFARTKFITTPSKQQRLLISIPVINGKEIQKWIAQTKSYTGGYQLSPLQSNFKGTQFCGSNGTCQIMYPNHPYLLKEEILDRISNEKKPFENAQMWYLAFTIIETVNVFHAKGQKCGDIRPLNIFLNDTGQALVGTKFSWPQQFDNYEKAVFEKQITYLSPQQIKDLHFGHTEPKSNIQISEAFSVGLTLLDSALLTDSADLYNQNTRFNFQKLQERVNELFKRPNFDKDMKFMIASLCRPDPLQRLTIKDLRAWMHQYWEYIIELQPFEITDIPPFAPNYRKGPQNYAQIPQPPFNNPVSSKTVPAQIGQSYVQSQVVAQYSHKPNPQVPQSVPYIAQNPAVMFGSKENKQNANVINTQPIQSNKSLGQNGEYRQTLQKIEEQLARSRQMFP